MSGGSLNYFYSYLEEHVGDLGDKELDNLVLDLAKLFHDREWELSGDIGKGDWIESKKAFKEKWFTPHGQQERIEQYLQEFNDEIREVFGLKTEYCQACKHWTERGTKSQYGSCEYEKTCLIHRSESCGKYERRESDDTR